MVREADVYRGLHQISWRWKSLTLRHEHAASGGTATAPLQMGVLPHVESVGDLDTPSNLPRVSPLLSGLVTRISTLITCSNKMHQQICYGPKCKRQAGPVTSGNRPSWVGVSLGLARHSGLGWGSLLSNPISQTPDPARQEAPLSSGPSTDKNKNPLQTTKLPVNPPCPGQSE